MSVDYNFELDPEALASGIFEATVSNDEDWREVARRWNAYGEMVRVLRIYHYDSREHGGQTDYCSPATILLRKLGELE